MKEKIIALIKKYRAESERLWNPNTGYPDDYCRVQALIFDRCADDLETVVNFYSK